MIVIFFFICVILIVTGASSINYASSTFPKYGAVFYNMKYYDNEGNIMSMLGEHVYAAWSALRSDGWAFPPSAPSNNNMFHGADDCPYTVSDYQITADAFTPSSSYSYSVTHERTSANEPRIDAFVFVYKAGHGGYDAGKDKGYIVLSYGNPVYPPDFPNGFSHYLRFYWNDGCYGNWGWFWALLKGHLVWGYKTTVSGDQSRVVKFFEYAFDESRTVKISFMDATIETLDTPDNSITPFISGRTIDQLDNDHMPGHGYIADDSDPTSNEAYIITWNT